MLGLPLAALSLARDGHEIALALCPRRRALGSRRLAGRLGARFAVVGAVDEAAGLARLHEARPELLVSWFFTKRIPSSWVAACPLGGFGVHPSLLPRHRGPDPYFWAIESGDQETGVTAHRLEADYDTGAILGQTRVALDPAWSAWTLAKRLDRPSLALLRDVTRRFAEGTVVERPQDDARATLAPEPSAELEELSADMTVEAFVRRIRALAPYPGGLLQVGDETLVIAEARPAEAPRALARGELGVLGGRAILRVADGGVELVAGRVVTDDGEVELRPAELVARASS